MKVVVASNNAHKIQELQAILTTLGMEAVPQKLLNINVDPEETGTTFEENSYIKAKAVLDACGLPTIADDTGLMVEALNGAPGVYSARYGGEACVTDRDRLNHLLDELGDLPEEQRGAKFVCVITLLTPDGKKIVARGECPGRILTAPRGENGFGYDPVFYVPEEGCTFAELPAQRKNSISHRARALVNFCAQLSQGESNPR